MFQWRSIRCFRSCDFASPATFDGRPSVSARPDLAWRPAGARPPDEPAALAPASQATGATGAADACKRWRRSQKNNGVVVFKQLRPCSTSSDGGSGGDDGGGGRRNTAGRRSLNRQRAADEDDEVLQSSKALAAQLAVDDGG